MLQEIETDAIESEREFETGAPQPTKAASLTGALVQRGRDRGPRLGDRAAEAPSAPAPAPAPAAVMAAVTDEVPLVFARPRERKAAPPAPRTRTSDALFAVACCAVFFATFLFVLRF